MDDLDACWGDKSCSILAIAPDPTPTSPSCSVVFVVRFAGAEKADTEFGIIALASARTMVDRGEFIEFPFRLSSLAVVIFSDVGVGRWGNMKWRR